MVMRMKREKGHLANKVCFHPSHTLSFTPIMSLLERVALVSLTALQPCFYS